MILFANWSTNTDFTGILTTISTVGEEHYLTKKAFSFSVPEEEQHHPQHEIEINGEQFKLANDLTGLELINVAGNATTLAGIHTLFSRVIADDDWDRFNKITEYFKISQFGEVSVGIINLYTEFPTIAVVDS